MGLEPMTSSLPRRCSTTELQQRPDAKPGERCGLEVQRAHVLRACALSERPARAPVVRTQGAPRASACHVTYGAGDGNRTHVISLEGWSSTIELRPRRAHAVGARHVVVIARHPTWERTSASAERLRRAPPPRSVARRAALCDASWWGEADLNRRRHSHQIYSLAHLATLVSPREEPPPCTRPRGGRGARCPVQTQAHVAPHVAGAALAVGGARDANDVTRRRRSAPVSSSRGRVSSEQPGPRWPGEPGAGALGGFGRVRLVRRGPVAAPSLEPAVGVEPTTS